MSSTFNIGFVSIHYYSICILIAILFGYGLAKLEAKRQNINTDFLFNLVFVTIVFGIIGARIYFVVFNLDYYLNNPLEIFMIWHGGLAIHGAIIAGLLTILVYCNKYKVRVFRILDLIVPSLILAQAIGRWGNFFNGEAHGPATTIDTLHSLLMPQFIIDGMNIGGVYYMPTFLFESLWCIIGFIILMVYRYNKKNRIGQLTAIYLIWYGFGRFFIEGMRTDSLMLLSLKMAQIVSIVMVVVGIIIFIISLKGKDNLYNDEKNKTEIKF